jgi:hypothetical protein
MAGPSQRLLKAHLGRDPKHPRALATLIEAVALWQGQQVRAALCAGAQGDLYDSNLYREALSDGDGGALYSLALVPTGSRGGRQGRIDGFGSFRELERLLIAEVAR